ncbi:TPA: hypothetical protein N0F65_007550 [Lagenidium giganteum]|uniref:Uncharacterized protein n=1 Tax=Lagenidium giganteum TaxID=4803 RepID=A0AAV2ZNK0_9STRA|nr:TPA: hypothetical protein N0F65_007550 [Lagenidium giganteum]
MCANRAHSCRVPSTTDTEAASEPKCLPIEPDTRDSETLLAMESTAPWETCYPAQQDGKRPLCRFQFSCMCGDPETNTDCLCVPPDATPAFVADNTTACGDSKVTCSSQQYCQWVREDKQACGLRPYSQHA